MVLTECRRGSADLFAFYSSLIEGGARFNVSLRQVVAEARERFAFEGPCRHNLVISHAKRVALNRELNRAARPRGAVLVRAAPQKGQLNAAQDMWVHVGLELLGCTQATKKGVRNNVLHNVNAIHVDAVTLSPGDLRLSFAEAAQWLRLACARTYASCQGTEFDGSLRLRDTDSRHFSMRHLFVAVSRAKEGCVVSVV